MKNFRTRTMGLLLYPDNKEHAQAVEEVKAFNHAIILHDKDTDKEGRAIKPHWHVVVRHKNAIWATALAKQLGITANYIQQVRNMENMLEYLIHHNEPDKHQYSIDEVKGPLRMELKKSIASDGKGEWEKVNEVIGYIEGRGAKVTMLEVAKWAGENGYWSELRRASGLIATIITELRAGRDKVLDEEKGMSYPRDGRVVETIVHVCRDCGEIKEDKRT